MPVSASELRDASSDYNVSAWSKKDALLPNSVLAIAQDRIGYLWLGTDSGLMRFDGIRFVPWDAMSDSPMPKGQIQALCVSRDGTLWAGFADPGGITSIRNNKPRTFGESDGLGSGSVNALAEDSQGTIWAGTASGLYRFAGSRWEKSSSLNGLKEASVSSIFVDRRGTLFVATVAGVFRRDEDKTTFHLVDAIDPPVLAFDEDSEGTVRVTDPVFGFRRLGERKTFAGSDERGRGRRLLRDRQDNLWVATSGQGLWRVRTRDPSSVYEDGHITRLRGLVAEGGMSLMEDREGNIWCGSITGLNRLTPHVLGSITNLGIARAIETTPDGSVWVGTDDRLIRFPGSGRQPRVAQNLPPGSRLQAMHADEHGVIWVATRAGLSRYADGRWSPVPREPGVRLEAISSIASDHHGGVWLSDLDRGLFHWRSGRYEGVTLPAQVLHSAVTLICVDRTDRLWVAFSSGAVAVSGTDGALNLLASHGKEGVGGYQAIYEDSRGVVWLGARNGLSRFANGELLSVDYADGLPMRTVRSIVEDDTHRLWFATADGVIRIKSGDLETLRDLPSGHVRYNNYDAAAGMAGVPLGSDFGSRRSIRTNDGQLWFISTRGVVTVDPHSLPEGRLPTSVRIEDAIADEKALPSLINSSLPPRTARIAIDYTILNLTSPGKVRFRYRLEGFDADWRDAGTRRQAIYTNLPPGAYRFRVSATNDEEERDYGDSWSFSIKPTFYQTAWFPFLCAASLAMSVWLAWRMHLQRVTREFSMLIEERARLSREVHDTLLQSLVGVALQCEAIAHDIDSPTQDAKHRFIRLRKQVEEYIREARQSIWDLRSPRIECTDLPEALKQAAARAGEGSQINIEFTVNGTPGRCSARAKEQLFRIGQEAILNAVRHANPRKVQVRLQYDRESVALSVKDDGCGFDAASRMGATGAHYGLIGMRERTEQLGGEFRIVSRIGGGTRVEAIVSTARHDDRHRGSGCPLTPATPPYVRVRIGRFEKLRRYSSTSEGRSGDLK